MIEAAARSLLEKHIIFLNNEGLRTSPIEKREYNFETSVISGKETLKLLVFFGKKGIKTIIQGNKESSLYQKVNTLLFGHNLFKAEEVSEPESYIGVDESGKGDYFGPLVIAGAFVSKEKINELVRAGVKDSKQITDTGIRKIASEIKKILTPQNFNIVIINPEKYNQLYIKIGNVNKLLAWGHARVMENLLSKVSTADVISDKFGNENYIIGSLMEEGKKIKLIQTHKGERFTGVAAASVLAREKFIEWFVLQEKKLKLILPKGASLSTENAAKNIVKNMGRDYLSKLAKLHFKTTKKILSD